MPPAALWVWGSGQHQAFAQVLVLKHAKTSKAKAPTIFRNEFTHNQLACRVGYPNSCTFLQDLGIDLTRPGHDVKSVE